MLRRLQALPERRVACLASNFRKCINGVVAHIDGTNAGGSTDDGLHWEADPFR